MKINTWVTVFISLNTTGTIVDHGEMVTYSGVVVLTKTGSEIQS